MKSIFPRIIIRVLKRIWHNSKAFLSRNFAEDRTEMCQQITQLSKQVSILSKEVSTLSQENLFLLRTCFDRDPWLAKAKDLHKGERCFLLGCGPSLNKLDLSKLQDEHTMGVNGTCLIESLHLEYFVTVAKHWWQSHQQHLKTLQCTRRFLPPYLRELDSQCPTTWLRIIEYKNYARLEKPIPWFFSTEVDRYIVLGGTVITVCLQLLYHFGFSEVILLGVDHNYDLDKEALGERGSFISSQQLPHFLANYYKGDVRVHVDLLAMERGYQLALEVFNRDGRNIFNASPGTKLEIFPKVDYLSLF